MNIEAKELSKIYGSGESRVVALDKVNLEIASSDFISIMGPSGSGKSTLLHLLSGLDRPTSGSLTYDGKDIYSFNDKELSAFRHQRIGFIFQQFNLLPVLTAKKGLKMKMQRGELVGFQGCLGYDYHPKDKSISVNEEEAEIVRYIFRRYIEGAGGSVIAQELENLGYKTKRGSTRWAETTVIGIIKNEKYKGDILMGKTFTLDPISKRRLDNFGEEDQFYIRDHHEAIISDEICDALMTAAWLLLMAYEMVGEAAHEWIGIGIFLLFLGHHILNLPWSKHICKGKYTAFRVVQTLIAVSLLLCMVGLAYSGVILSCHIFSALPIRGGQSVARTLHLLCSYWSFVLMGIHLGLHWNMIMGIAGKGRKKSYVRVILLRMMAVMIAVYGSHAFFTRQIGIYMFLQSHFVFFNYEEPFLFFLLDYMAIIGLFVFLGHCIAKFFRTEKPKT